MGCPNVSKLRPDHELNGRMCVGGVGCLIQRCPAHVPDCQPGQYITREQWGKVGGLTAAEQRTHFALWCMMASPLLLGNDPRTMTRCHLRRKRTRTRTPRTWVFKA